MTMTDEDILIGRVAANEAGSDEWRRFEALAAAAPDAWERLARSLRDELQVRLAFAETLESAESIDIPVEAFETPSISIRTRAWTGWAIAAAVLLAWSGIAFFLPTRGERTVNETGLGIVPAANADDAFRDYVTLGSREGRVLQELPMVMLETRAIDGGRVEVFYVRQLLEKARIDSAYELQRDELGRPSTGRIDLATFTKDRDSGL